MVEDRALDRGLTQHVPLEARQRVAAQAVPEQLSARLKEARASGGPELSRNEVLTAWLWQRYAPAWHAPDERISVSCALDFRRLFEAATPLYFGNAARGAVVQLACAEVARASLGELAARVRASVAAGDRAAVERMLRCVAGLRAHGWFQETRPMALRGSHPDDTLLVTNLSRVPLAQLDCGRGAPKELYPAGGARAASVFAADGDVKILVGLRTSDSQGSQQRFD